MQFGVVNAARSAASGLRFGVVNVARARRGFQFGVVNVAAARRRRVVRALNVIGNGIHDVSLFATDVMATNIGFKLGGRHLYTNLIAGYQPGDDARGRHRALLAPAAGASGPAPASAGASPSSAARSRTLELEADWIEVRRSGAGSRTRPACRRCACRRALRLAPYVVLLAGAGVNVAVATGAATWIWPDVAQSVQHSGDTTVRIYPGLLLGLQI